MTFSLLNPYVALVGGAAAAVVALVVLIVWSLRAGRSAPVPPDAVRCAACGASVVLMKRWREQGTMQAYCYNCGAMGQEAESREEAVMLWNRKQENRRREKQEATEGSEGLLSLHGADVIADEIEEGGR